MKNGRNVVLLVLTGFAMHAPVATAQTDEGITVDPASPAGKEYALPLDRARREATPSAKDDRSSDGVPAAAFGEGVGPEPGRASGDAAADGQGGAAGTSASPSGAEPPGSDAEPSGDAPRTTSVERSRESQKVDRALVQAGVGSDATGGGTTALLLGGLAATVLGIAAGLLLRRRAD